MRFDDAVMERMFCAVYAENLTAATLAHSWRIR
jgi:hypothetical protein